MKMKQTMLMLMAVAIGGMTTACHNDVADWQEAKPTAVTDGEEAHTARMVLAGTVSRFDASANTRAAQEWASGAQVYLQFTNDDEQRVRGIATYNSTTGEWLVTYNGTLTTDEESKCEAYFFENPDKANTVTVELTPQSAVYADRNAKYLLKDGVVTVTAQLTPLTGRVRFKGTAGQTVNCAGMKSYGSYSVSANTLTEQVVNSELTIADDGYTPYVYTMWFDATKRELTIDANKSNYYRKAFAQTVLAQGKSGFIELPTKAKPNGWMLIPMKEEYSVGGVTFSMVRVLPGSFQMGSISGSDDEKPVHQVIISKEYFVGETEVTQALWTVVMNGKNPSYFKGDNFPVEKVSWNDCKTFITNLNTLTGGSFRLLTEAEWEFAARGGLKSKGFTYSGSNTIDDVAWYTDNSISKTHAVKTKQSNELGIYDMTGNVWEWCNDYYSSYTANAVTDPQGPNTGSSRVNRGGSWYESATDNRVTLRNIGHPTSMGFNRGLRLASQ